MLLESLIGFGMFVCDSFLYPFTYLPLRCLYALYLLISDLLSVLPASIKPYVEAKLVLSPRRGSGRLSPRDGGSGNEGTCGRTSPFSPL